MLCIFSSGYATHTLSYPKGMDLVVAHFTPFIICLELIEYVNLTSCIIRMYASFLPSGFRISVNYDHSYNSKKNTYK